MEPARRAAHNACNHNVQAWFSRLLWMRCGLFTAARRTRVMLVDDEPLVRQRLALRLAAEPDLVVCGEAAGERQALKRIKAAKADLAVVDLDLRQGSGLNLIRQLRLRRPAMQIVVFSTRTQMAYVASAVAGGAHGYVAKHEDTDTLLEAVRVVAHGKFYLSRAVDARQSSPPSASPPASRSPATLRHNLRKP